MDDQARHDASDLLWEHWQAGRTLSALPERLRPATRAEGYAVQALLESRAAGPLFGWKIAATSRAGQAHIGVDGPLAGRLLPERVRPLGRTLVLGANHMRVAEAEFAFRMARDLAPRIRPYSVDEVMAAVGALHPAIEIPDSRFDDFTAVGAAQLIADNACAHDFVLGPEAPPSWHAVDLAAHPVRERVGDVEREGSGSHVLGDPRLALTWLVNELGGIGETLRAGEIVTTGACVPPMPVAPGDRVTCDFGALGTISIEFAGA
jgi:2-keto-4-pentenoate hydratase